MLAVPLDKLAVGVKVAVRVSPVPAKLLSVPLVIATSPREKLVPMSSLNVKLMVAV